MAGERRLRPETYAGRVHNHATDARHPISAALLNSAAVSATFSKNGNYLLTQAWKTVLGASVVSVGTRGLRVRQ